IATRVCKSDRSVSYGFGENVDYRAQNVTLEDFASVFSVFRRGEKLGEARLSVPGRHNVQNAVGVGALATELAIPFEKIAAALAKFRHARRRDNPHGDRKSTRLNSSHLGISYAVFCLK